tara:strand:- start:9365 stop:10342 length:978 start_codon:yes stop_codon:yes gene_type:complete
MDLPIITEEVCTMISILYGSHGMPMIECTERFYTEGMGAFIPSGDLERLWTVGADKDPHPGVKKVIVVHQCLEDGRQVLTTIPAAQSARISPDGHLALDEDPIRRATDRLSRLHDGMVELPEDHALEHMEQVMSCMHVRGTERILEIGGNVGRNTAVLGQIMKERAAGGSITTLETLKDEAGRLEKLVRTNGFPVKVVNAALSRTELVQYGWNTAPKGAPGTEGWWDVQTVALEELTKEGDFDTLVVDCEGAFEGVLAEWPELLETVDVVQIENDFNVDASATNVMLALQKAGFYLWFSAPLQSWHSFPRGHQFYQIFRKKDSRN